MFSIARSRYALPVQFLFLAVNAIGLFFGVAYNIKTPDLYVNNAHHGIGWVSTWMVTALFITNLLSRYSKSGKERFHSPRGERAACLPMSVENMAQHNSEPSEGYGWPEHRRQGSSDSSTLHSQDAPPTLGRRRDTFDEFNKPAPDLESEDEEEVQLSRHCGQKFCRLRNNCIAAVNKYLLARLPKMASIKVLRTVKFVYNVLDRLMLLLGFIAMVTGFITYCGLFVSNSQPRRRPPLLLFEHLTNLE